MLARLTIETSLIVTPAAMPTVAGRGRVAFGEPEECSCPRSVFSDTWPPASTVVAFAKSASDCRVDDAYRERRPRGVSAPPPSPVDGFGCFACFEEVLPPFDFLHTSVALWEVFLSDFWLLILLGVFRPLSFRFA